MWQEDELEACAAAGVHAGLCADITANLPLHRGAPERGDSPLLKKILFLSGNLSEFSF